MCKKLMQVRAMLLELCVGQVRGFDLSSLDAYRWHPGTERIEIDRYVTVALVRLQHETRPSCSMHIFTCVGGAVSITVLHLRHVIRPLNKQRAYRAGCHTSACQRPSTC